MYKSKRLKRKLPLVQYKSLVPLWKTSGLADWVTASPSVYKQQFTRDWVNQSSRIPLQILSNPLENSEHDSTTAFDASQDSEDITLPDSVDHIPSEQQHYLIHHEENEEKEEKEKKSTPPPPPPMVQYNPKKPIDHGIIYDARNTFYAAIANIDSDEDKPLAPPLPPRLRGPKVAKKKSLGSRKTVKVNVNPSLAKSRKSSFTKPFILTHVRHAERQRRRMEQMTWIKKRTTPTIPKPRDLFRDISSTAVPQSRKDNKEVVPVTPRSTQQAPLQPKKKLRKKLLGGTLVTVPHSFVKAVRSSAINEWKIDLRKNEMIQDRSSRKSKTPKRPKLKLGEDKSPKFKSGQERKEKSKKSVHATQGPFDSDLSHSQRDGSELSRPPYLKSKKKSKKIEIGQARATKILVTARPVVEKLFFKNLKSESESQIADSKMNIGSTAAEGQHEQIKLENEESLSGQIEAEGMVSPLPPSGENEAKETFPEFLEKVKDQEKNGKDPVGWSGKVKKYYGKFPESPRSPGGNPELDLYLQHLDMTHAEGQDVDKDDNVPKVTGDQTPTELYSPFEQLSTPGGLNSPPHGNRAKSRVNTTNKFHENLKNLSTVSHPLELTDFLRKVKPSLINNQRLDWSNKPKPKHLYFDSKIMPTRKDGIIHKMPPLSRKEILMRMKFEENDRHRGHLNEHKFPNPHGDGDSEDDLSVHRMRLSGSSFQVHSEENVTGQSETSIVVQKRQGNSKRPSFVRRQVVKPRGVKGK